MFRTSKSENAIERLRYGDEADHRSSASRGAIDSVASSAMRWLRGPKKEEVEPFDTDPADDLELTVSLDDDAPAAAERDDRANGDAPRTEARQTGSDNGEARTATVDRVRPFDLYDDDDDVDDFDDLGSLDGVMPPEPPEERSILAGINLDDLPQPGDHSGPASLPADLDAATSGPHEKVEQDETAQTPESRSDRAIQETTEIDPPVVSVPLEAPSSRNAIQTNPPATRHGVVDIAQFDASLALQPIPELQANVPETLESSPDQADPEDVQVPSADETLIDQDSTAPETLLDDVVDLDTPIGETDGVESAQDADDLGIGELEDDPLDLEPSAGANNHDSDDWHAHLADALGVDDGPETGAAEDSEAEAEEVSLRPHEVGEPAIPRDNEPSAVLPLSKTLSDLAMSGEPEEKEDKDFLVDKSVDAPSFPTVTARQQASGFQPPSALAAGTAELSPEQVSLGIVANLPRLRRFAAVQIGDELIADRLVQSTIETALADPGALEPTYDLGLALISLSLRLRRMMLRDPLASVDDDPEAMRAFETAVCSGLAGADQFEIRQFARAINALDEGDRTLLILVALENFSYQQIAVMQNMPADQVMGSVSDARMRLRQALATDESGMSIKTTVDDAPHEQEIEIHGYLDGELDGRHMADIDALVECDEDAAERLLHYGIQGDLIRRLYAPLLNRPLPGSILDAVSAAARPARRGFLFGSRRALIAGAIVIALCGSAIWPYVGPALNASISDAKADFESGE